MSEYNDQSTVSDSPQSRERGLKFSIFEPIFGIIISLVATIVFLGFPHIITVVLIGGPVIPTFYSEVIRSLWIPIVLWAIFRVGVDISYLYERRYTERLAKIAVIGNVLTAICTFIIFISPRIVNQDYINFIHDYFRNVSVWFGNILANPNLIILVLIMVILILESINVVRKGMKAKKREEGEDEAAQQADASSSEHDKETNEKKFSYFEPFKGIIFTVVATVIFLGFPQIITFVFTDRLIPTFDAVVIRCLWIPFVLWALLRIGIEVAYMIERRYTKRLAIITVAGDVLAVICGIIIFISPRIVNGEYIDFIHRYFEDMAAWFSVILTRILDRPNLIILVIMIVVLAIESFNMVRRSRADDEEDDGDGDGDRENIAQVSAAVTEAVNNDEVSS